MMRMRAGKVCRRGEEGTYEAATNRTLPHSHSHSHSPNPTKIYLIMSCSKNIYLNSGDTSPPSSGAGRPNAHLPIESYPQSPSSKFPPTNPNQIPNIQAHSANYERPRSPPASPSPHSPPFPPLPTIRHLVHRGPSKRICLPGRLVPATKVGYVVSLSSA